MEKMTITEALAEIKLINAKVDKKREFILSYVVRHNNLVDPLGDSGGSRKVLEAEQQAVKDLLLRKVTIRRAIHEANSKVLVAAGGLEMPIADWLIWKREVAPQSQVFLASLKQKIDQARIIAAQQRVTLVAAEKQADAQPTDIITNLSERKLGEAAEVLTTILATLDGQLSLKNATVTVEF